MVPREYGTESESDFGYEAIPWEDTTDENVAAVEAEYKARLSEASGAWADLEQKARLTFGGLLIITTALAGWTFSRAGLEPPFFVGLTTLTTLFAVAALAAAFSLFPKPYGASAGVTPNDLNVSHWGPLLLGGEGELLRLRGVRIKEYARGISLCERSSRQKSRFLKLSIGTAVTAFPASAITALFAAVIPS